MNRMKGIFRPLAMWLVALPLIIFLASCSSPELKKEGVTVAVAASLALPMTEIVRNYEEKSGAEIEIITGSSGKITAQVVAGAPYDLFLSADTDYPDALVEKGFTRGRTTVFAQGALVLFVRKKDSSFDFEQLLNEEIKTVAIPNPEVAPYGRAAIQALKKVGIYGQVKPKLIYGESVGQVNQFLHSGAVDAGITSATSKSIKQQNYTVHHVDEVLYSPIRHGVVKLKSAGVGAEEFLDYLLSEEGQLVLEGAIR